MRVIQIQDNFGVENLKIAERPDPTPGPGQVLLKMRAASLNFRDINMVTGRYNPQQPLPLMEGRGVAGQVQPRERRATDQPGIERVPRLVDDRRQEPSDKSQVRRERKDRRECRADDH